MSGVVASRGPGEANHWSQQMRYLDEHARLTVT